MKRAQLTCRKVKLLSACALSAIAVSAALIAAPATEPTTQPAAAPSTEPSAVAPSTAPSATPSTAPAVAEAPATQAAIVHAPSTGPAVAENASTQPSVAHAPTTGPATHPTDVAHAESPSGFSSKKPSTGPSVASSTDPRRSSRSSRDRTPPTAEPATAKGERITDEFAVLLTRSIFAKDQKPEPDTSRPKGDIDFTREERPDISFGGPSRTEGSIAVRGVLEADGAYAAFVEDPNTHKTSRVNVGDKLAKGHVTAITIDGIDYEVSGRTRHVLIGQTLDGASLASSTTRPSTMPTFDIAADLPGSPEQLTNLRSRRKTEWDGTGVSLERPPLLLGSPPILPGTPEAIDKMKKRRLDQMNQLQTPPEGQPEPAPEAPKN